MNKYIVLSLLLFGLAAGCANKELSELLTPGSDLNNYYSQKAPNVNESPKSAATTWTESRADAMVWAENSKKIVLANFTGSDWCVWCNRLEEEVFETPEFLNWANKNAVLLRLDYPRNTEQLPALKAQNSQLAQIYNPYITGYPTVLFIDHEGNVLGKVGYVKGGPQAWIAAANQQLGIR